MKCIIFFISLLSLFSCCDTKRKNIIQDKNQSHFFLLDSTLTKVECKDFNNYDFSYRDVDPFYPADSVWHTYFLEYNKGIDTFFTKQKTFLDSINYYRCSVFFQDIKRVRSFWKGAKIGARNDSLQIYVIERQKNNDSLLIYKVTRGIVPIL